MRTSLKWLLRARPRRISVAGKGLRMDSELTRLTLSDVADAADRAIPIHMAWQRANAAILVFQQRQTAIQNTPLKGAPARATFWAELNVLLLNNGKRRGAAISYRLRDDLARALHITAVVDAGAQQALVGSHKRGVDLPRLHPGLNENHVCSGQREQHDASSLKRQRLATAARCAAGRGGRNSST